MGNAPDPELEAILEDYRSLPEYSGLSLSNVKTPSLFGDWPINIAATRGSLHELSVLLRSGAEINAKGEHQYTPLHNSVEQGKLEAVRLLVENGADLSARNINGQTPLDLAGVLEEGLIAAYLREKSTSQ